MNGTEGSRNARTRGHPTGRRGILLMLFLYPVITLLTRSCVFFTAFDSETVTRFVQEFLFGGHATPGWAAAESLRWGLTRPVYSLTFLADFLLFGTDSRLYHATDFLIAWITMLVLASLLLRHRGRFEAWACLMIWAVMPSQAWSLFTFTGRNDRLASLFVLLAVRETAGWRDGPPGWLRQLAVPLLLLLGFLSKESAAACFVLPFAWLVLVEGWTPGSVLGRTRPALIPSLLLPFACFGVRAAFSLPLGDVGPLPGPVDCLTQFGRFVDFGLGSPGAVDPLLLGAFSVASLACAVALRRLPPLTRFGALVILLSVIPFSFTWIQHTFHWLPSLGVSLALAGVLAAAGGSGRLRHARIAVLTAAVMSYAWWGRMEAGNVCAQGVAARQAAIEAAGEGGPSIDGASILADHPSLAANLGYGPGIDFTGRAQVKMRCYLEDLVQVELRDPEAFILWPSPAGGVSR